MCRRHGDTIQVQCKTARETFCNSPAFAKNEDNVHSTQFTTLKSLQMSLRSWE